MVPEHKIERTRTLTVKGLKHYVMREEHFSNYKIVDNRVKSKTSEKIQALSIANKNEGVAFYPNPVINNLWVQLPQQSIEMVTQISIADIMGRIIFTKSVTNNLLQLDVSGFTKGIYIIKVETTGLPIQTGRFIKQ